LGLGLTRRMPTEKQNHIFPKVGFDKACANRGERPPRVHLHLDRIFVGSHNSISGASRIP
jgi:hypothetical protein